jgi:hypothetical protein
MCMCRAKVKLIRRDFFYMCHYNIVLEYGVYATMGNREHFVVWLCDGQHCGLPGNELIFELESIKHPTEY